MEEDKKEGAIKAEDAVNEEEKKDQVGSILGEFLQTDKLYVIAFCVLGLLILLCLLFAFILEPEMYVRVS